MNDELNLNWSEPRVVRGRSLRISEPSAEFWAAWRSDKAAIKALGISCRPASGGWEVIEWSDAPLSVVSSEKPVDSVPIVASRQARYVEGFSAPELNLKPGVILSDEQVKITLEYWKGFHTATSNEYRVIKIIGAVSVEVFSGSMYLTARVGDMINEKQATELASRDNVEAITIPRP